MDFIPVNEPDLRETKKYVKECIDTSGYLLKDLLWNALNRHSGTNNA